MAWLCCSRKGSLPDPESGVSREQASATLRRAAQHADSGTTRTGPEQLQERAACGYPLVYGLPICKDGYPPV